jgi:hypothetical protein
MCDGMMGTAKAPNAAHFGCLYPNPPSFPGIFAMRDACVGRLSSSVSVMKHRKKLSVVSMALRKGVVHLVGSLGGGCWTSIVTPLLLLGIRSLNLS